MEEVYIMKATGIVRRIDDLGRVVIPKEIRRTMRIREGDPLEIYTDRDGEVIFKKYSPIGELGQFAAQFAETLAKTCGMPVVITDRDAVIAVFGTGKKEYSDRRISDDMERYMSSRQTYMSKSGETSKISVVEGAEKSVMVMVPILAQGDVIGSVVVLQSDTNTIPGDVELKLAQAAAAFLGRQMES
jgi:AbrB family transcriptional regulator (stage V sporulation protein T)